jgi:hypothetical protein
MDKEATMKISVITDKNGKIIGTAHHGVKGKPEAGHGGPVAGPGQRVHVIDLPNELEKANAEELHRNLKAHLQSK